MLITLFFFVNKKKLEIFPITPPPPNFPDIFQIVLS